MRRRAKPTERVHYRDCENLTMKECGSEELVVQRDEMACSSNCGSVTGDREIISVVFCV